MTTNALSSWVLPILPASWVQYNTVSFEKAAATSVLRYGTAVSVLCSTLTRTSIAKKLLLLWGGAEVAFYLFQRHRYDIVNSRWPEDLDEDKLKLVQKRFLALPDVLSMQDFLSGWFHGAPFDTIRRDNVLEYVAYVFHDGVYKDLSAEAQQSSNSFLVEVERNWGINFVPGYNPDLTFMAHRWEPLRVLHKPLLVHVVSEVWGFCMHLYLRAIGFQHADMEGFSYWVRNPATGPLTKVGGCDLTSEPADADAAQKLSQTRPVVFLHGVGFGLTPYILFMRMLFAATASHPMIVLEFRHISMRLCLRATEVDHAAHAVAAIVKQQGFKEACVVGHSFGTFVASRLCQMHPAMVQSLLLIDPVCMMTCAPQLLHSFVYKIPTWGKHLLTPVGFMDLIRFACSRDLIIAEAFCRKFCWHSLMLWPEDMPAACTVSISANDSLVPFDLVRAQIKAAETSPKIIVHPTAGHGAYLLDGKYQHMLALEVKSLASRKALE